MNDKVPEPKGDFYQLVISDLSGVILYKLWHFTEEAAQIACDVLDRCFIQNGETCEYYVSHYKDGNWVSSTVITPREAKASSYANH